MGGRRGGRTATIAAVAVSLILASGCAPEPAPDPTPTGFTSETEAFAAAEATYRSYIDAVNRVQFDDPDTFEAVFVWTTGELKSVDRQSFTEYANQGYEVTGEFKISELEPLSWNATDGQVELAVCLDVSGIDLLDGDGASVVNSERVPVQPMLITVVPDETSPKRMAVSNTSAREEGSAC